TSTLVMAERPPEYLRPTYLHHRGEYLQPRDEVQPGIPEILNAAGTADPRNRLDFARWLVSDDNPLTARVVVNRHWEAFFGTGIVKTADDFGAQGDPPSHPELLDWLALRFVDSGWDVKALMKLIVTSAAYRQSSVATAEQRKLDPDNRLLSRM
ncbi:MAG: DUF1553 domain-containing protein, partial [Planctomycetaceae bacterium]|nr:DUF1553 domain-containing protein [Planctomycetaceae bacterium]